MKGPLPLGEGDAMGAALLPSRKQFVAERCRSEGTIVHHRQNAVLTKIQSIALPCEVSQCRRAQHSAGQAWGQRSRKIREAWRGFYHRLRANDSASALSL
jgi:hypothetical protein